RERENERDEQRRQLVVSDDDSRSDEAETTLAHEVNGGVVGRLAPDEAGSGLQHEEPADGDNHLRQRRPSLKGTDRQALDDESEHHAGRDRREESEDRRQPP